MIRSLSRLRRDKRGVAMVEFAFGLPLLLLTSCYAVEIANYALAQLRVSQLALALADNASRVGVASNLAEQQLREVDLVDVLQATRTQGQQLNITKYGRVTLSSLEADAGNVQRIHWQRCIGLKSGADYESHYGKAAVSDGTEAGPAFQGPTVTGMGAAGSQVTAPPQSGVMFVEVNYDYRPLFGDWLVANRRIHYIASFIVRDRRDFKRVYNPKPEIASRPTCDKYTT